MDLSSSTVRRLEQILGKDTAAEVYRGFSSVGGAVVHLEGNEEIRGMKTFTASIGVHGVSYSWPARNRSGALMNDGKGNLSWSTVEGTGTVTSVGIVAPPEFMVSDPICVSGDIVLTKTPQAACTVYAGPPAGRSAQPGFRRLVASDLPTLPIGHIEGLSDRMKEKVSIEEIRSLKDALGLLEVLIKDREEGWQLELAEEIEKLKSCVFDAILSLQDSTTRKFDDQLELMKRSISRASSELDDKLSDIARSDGPEFTGVVQIQDMQFVGGSCLSFGMEEGVRIGKTRGEKLAFYGRIPVSQPDGEIISAIANLGLIRNPTISQASVSGLLGRLEAIEKRIEAFDA